MVTRGHCHLAEPVEERHLRVLVLSVLHEVWRQSQEVHQKQHEEGGGRQYDRVINC